MKRRLIYAPLLTLLINSLLLCAYSAALPGDDPQQKQPKTAPKKGGDSMTGCVDEQSSHYVLVNDRTMVPIANLEADGFPTEGFAKHMGHKVTVRGTVSSSGTTPVFKVSSIETLSEICAPQQ